MDSSLKQYTELYEANREALERHSAAPLNALRGEALERLTRDGARLPGLRDEGYEKTSLEKMFAPDFGLNINRVDIPVDVAESFRCAVPHMSTLLGVTVNDAFHPVGQLETKLPEGVRFMSLKRAAEVCPDVLEKYYGRLAPKGETPVALNTLLCQDGVLIHVGSGVRSDRTLQLVNIFSAPAPLMAARRLLIVVEEGASLQLLMCDHTQDGENAYLSDQVAEIYLGERASLDLCDIEESSARSSRLSQTWVRQSAGSRLNHATVTLTCGTTRNDVNVAIDGEGCDTFLAGMAIGDAKMHVDNHTAVSHHARRSRSNQLFKYVLDGEAQGAFEGSIVVSDGAGQTEAYQSNRNILASSEARMHTKPQLEIYEDDVKCSHGATTGQLDQEAIFYMQTRGIPLAEARTMLMQAFMSDVIDTVAIDGLRDRLRHLVDNRFSHSGDAACDDCRNTTCRK